MKISPSQIKVGMELYQYSSKILRYVVIGINELVTEEHTEKFYILECQDCTDHDKCKVAVKFDEYGDLVYSHMINHYNEYQEENEHYRNSQYYWHKNKEHHWFLNRTDARLYIHSKNIDFYKSEIKRFEGFIEENKELILKEQDKINALEEKSPPHIKR